MFRALTFAALLPVAGCGIGPCRQMCNRDADCIQIEIDDNDSTWEDWTGFESRKAFVGACLDTFDDSLAAAGKDNRGRLKKRCKAELKQECSGI